MRMATAPWPSAEAMRSRQSEAVVSSQFAKLQAQAQAPVKFSFQASVAIIWGLAALYLTAAGYLLQWHQGQERIRRPRVVSGHHFVVHVPVCRRRRRDASSSSNRPTIEPPRYQRPSKERSLRVRILQESCENILPRPLIIGREPRCPVRVTASQKFQGPDHFLATAQTNKRR